MLGFFLGEILGFFIGFLLCACLVARKGRIMAFELTEEEFSETERGKKGFGSTGV